MIMLKYIVKIYISRLYKSPRKPRPSLSSFYASLLFSVITKATLYNEIFNGSIPYTEPYLNFLIYIHFAVFQISPLIEMPY